MRTGSLLLALLALLAAAMLVSAGCTTTPPTNQTNTTTPTAVGTGTPVVTLLPTANVTPNGTANATTPSLTNVTWQWNALQSAAGANLTVVSSPQNYTITFVNATQYSIKADCNVGGGTFTSSGSTITIHPSAVTLIFCGNQSQDSLFLDSLRNVTAYDLTPNRLVLTLNETGNKMVFSSASVAPNVSAPFVNSTYRWIARAGSQSISVPSPDRYTISFAPNGTYTLRADCNNGTGNFTVNGTKVKINPATLTRMYCGDASLDKTYTASLGQVTGYEIDASGRLVLIMVSNNERLTFTKIA